MFGPTVKGGGYRHVWDSGGDAILSHTIEIGHPRLVTPVFFRHLSTVAESLAFKIGQEGSANAKLQLVAHGGETEGDVPVITLRRNAGTAQGDFMPSAGSSHYARAAGR